MSLPKILPSKLKIGDTIGVVAPSSPIIGENIDEFINDGYEFIDKKINDDIVIY